MKMAKVHNGNGNGVIDLRRRLVSQILLRQPDITKREMVEFVGQKIINPETGSSFSIGTIHNDMIAVREGWKERSAQNYDELVAEQKAMLYDLYAEARKKGKLNIAIDCIKELNKMIGAYAPERHDITSGGEKLQKVEIIEVIKSGAGEE